jgi:excisionase family DNA binding protein
MQNVILTSIPLKELTDLLQEIVKVEMAQFVPQPHPQPIAAQHTDLLTRKEAAQLLGVSLPTLHRWTQQHVLTGYRINTRVRYKRAEVEQGLKTICVHNQKKGGIRWKT